MLSKASKYCVFVFLGLCLIFVSCYEPIKGCQDVLAVNYSVTADETCDEDVTDCCRYPNLFLTISQKVGEELFSEDSIYLNALNQEYCLPRAIFFISDVSLESEDGEISYINDKISGNSLLAGNLESVSTKDDVVLVRKPLINFDIGEFVQPEKNFTKLRFSVGLDDTLNHFDISSLDESHVFQSSDSLFVSLEDGFIQAQFTIGNKMMMDTSSYTFVGDDVIRHFEFDVDTMATRGVNFYLPLQVDYEQWLWGVNFELDSKEDIINKMKANTMNSFSIN